MGDHRASIKITFEMHGVTSEADMWINWSFSEYDLPSSVMDFFRDAAQKSLDKFEDDQRAAHAEKTTRTRELLSAAKAKLTPDELAALRDEIIQSDSTE